MATVPGNVVRVSLLWQPPTVWLPELAVNTFHLQSQAGPSGPTPNPQYIADQVAAKLIADFPAMAGRWPSSIHMTAVKTYLLDSAGLTTAEGVHAFSPTDVQGSSGGGVLPPEVAVCLSEYSYTPGSFAPAKGRRRGRMYLPYLAQTTMDAQGMVAATAATDITTGFQTLFNDINTIESDSGRTDPMGLVVLSRAAGATFEVLHLAVDNHFDAQRRRQHQVPPTLTTVELSPW